MQAKKIIIIKTLLTIFHSFVWDSKINDKNCFNLFLSVEKKSQLAGKQLKLLAIVFIVLVFPRELLHLVYMMSWKVGEGFPYTHTLRNINSFLKILHMSNSIANIFIYAGLMGRFRKKLYGLLSAMIGRKFVSKTIKATTSFSDDSAINSTEKSSFTYTVKSKQ